MARKKKKKTGGLFGIFSKKKKTGRSKRKSSDSIVGGLKVTLSIMFLTILIAGGAIALIYMDRYVHNVARIKGEDGFLEAIEGPLKLIDAPTWLTSDWTDALVDAAGGKNFKLNETSAKLVAERLNSLSWLDHVQVQTTPEYLEVRAIYRRPVALVRLGRNRKVYLDADMIVLDFIPVTTIPVIEIKGLASTKLPLPNHKWIAADAEAAIQLLDLLYKVDKLYEQERKKRQDNNTGLSENAIPEKPLLNEIEIIDVSNFGGRKSTSAPNIVLNVVDGTRIYWGAALGQASANFEPDEKIKRARLYQFFIDHNNTLQGSAKYIDLCWLEDSIPRPR